MAGSGTAAGTELAAMVTSKTVSAGPFTVPTSSTYKFIGRGPKIVNGIDYADVMTIEVYIINLNSVPPVRTAADFNVALLNPT